MDKRKKRLVIIIIVCLFLLIGGFIADRVTSKSYLNELKLKEVLKKVKGKEDFILVISQTQCSHCMSYKPKLAEVAKEYKLNMYYIDVDLLTKEEEDSLKEYFSYSGTPDTIFIHDGEEKTAANRINGDASKDKIIKKLKSNGFIN